MDDLLDRAPCGYVSFGDDGRIERINRTLLEMLGYECGELAGRHFEVLLTVGGRIFYQTHWFPLLRLHERAEEVFLLLRTKGGEDVGVLVNAVRRERDGRASYECIMMQVRERRKYEDELLRARRTAEEAKVELERQKLELELANAQLEEQAVELELQQQQLQEQTAAAEEANKAKSTFLAVMSHELRTPLNAISGYVELLEIGVYGSITDEQRNALDRVNRSQRHLLRLINDVLNLARVEAGRVDYLISDIAIADVVADVCDMVEPQLAAKRLSFEIDTASDLIARADREKVQQILLNLLSNALKFTPEGGSITLAAREEPGKPARVRIDVTDSGIGIPEDRLSSVFEPFVQVDTSEKSRKQGTGLGLAISRDLARGMGGDLSARSVPGQGSTFSLVLPAAAAAAGGAGGSVARCR